MTRYTVSPPMLIEKSDIMKPRLWEFEAKMYPSLSYENAMAFYEQHLSSLQQIRMSEELVKWCEEQGIKEVSSEQIEIKSVPVMEDFQDYYNQELAFPVEVVDDQDELWGQLDRTIEAMTGNDPLQKWELDTLKKMFKLTRI